MQRRTAPWPRVDSRAEELRRERSEWDSLGRIVTWAEAHPADARELAIVESIIHDRDQGGDDDGRI